MRPQPVGGPTLKTSAAAQDRGYVYGIAIALTVLLGILVAASTIYGVHRFYSPIPFWDEWDGYIGFYREVTNGGALSWWVAQHNEHRIFTSRVLFWFDIRYLHGNHILLLASMLAMLAGIVLIISKAAQAPKIWTAGLGVALMFAWVQHEVLTWGFETQVVAANFFVVLASFFFCQFQWPSRDRFLAAYAAAILAELSMANGIGVYALLIGATIFARRPRLEIVLTAALGVVLTSVYFIGYVSTESHDPASGLNGVLEKAQFFALVMANPLAVAGFSIQKCIAVGSATFAAGAFIGWRIYRTKTATSYRTFLVCLFVFTVLSAAAITKGRSMGGLGGALASRYAMGPLLGWWALALLAFDYFSKPAARTAVIVVSLILAVAVATGQQQVMTDNGYLYQWKLAVLSNRIGLERKDLTSQIFPQDDRAVRFEANTAYAAARHLAIYDSQWLRDAGQVKFDLKRVETGWCQGVLESVSSDAQGPIASGWAASPAGDNALIVLTDATGETVGYGVAGIAREDVSKAIPNAPPQPGWKGFASSKPTNAYVYADERFCKLSVASP